MSEAEPHAPRMLGWDAAAGHEANGTLILGDIRFDAEQVFSVWDGIDWKVIEYLPIERVTEGGHPPIKHSEWMRLLTSRFGPDPRDWAFVCPGCGDVATGKDLEEALARNPRSHKDGNRPFTFGDLLGQECIGRTLGALETGNEVEWDGRGCTWCAYGLIPGPIGVHLPNGQEIRVFKAAPAEATQLRTSVDLTVET